MMHAEDDAERVKQYIDGVQVADTDTGEYYTAKLVAHDIIQAEHNTRDQTIVFMPANLYAQLQRGEYYLPENVDEFRTALEWLASDRHDGSSDVIRGP